MNAFSQGDISNSPEVKAESQSTDHENAEDDKVESDADDAESSREDTDTDGAEQDQDEDGDDNDSDDGSATTVNEHDKRRGSGEPAETPITRQCKGGCSRILPLYWFLSAPRGNDGPKKDVYQALSCHTCRYFHTRIANDFEGIERSAQTRINNIYKLIGSYESVPLQDGSTAACQFTEQDFDDGERLMPLLRVAKANSAIVRSEMISKLNSFLEKNRAFLGRKRVHIDDPQESSASHKRAKVRPNGGTLLAGFATETSSTVTETRMSNSQSEESMRVDHILDEAQIVLKTLQGVEGNIDKSMELLREAKIQIGNKKKSLADYIELGEFLAPLTRHQQAMNQHVRADFERIDQMAVSIRKDSDLQRQLRALERPWMT